MSKNQQEDRSKKCHLCAAAIYIGDGCYLCEYTASVVIEDWLPTEDYYCCKGKGFEDI